MAQVRVGGTLLWLQRLSGLFTLLLGLMVLGVAGLWGGAHTEWASRWVFDFLSPLGVRVTAPQGALLGEFRAERIEVDLPRGGALIVQAPVWRGLTLRPDLEVAWWIGVRAQGLSAKHVQLNWVPGLESGKPLAPPGDLSLPLSVRLERVQVEEFSSNLTGQVPFKGVEASLALHDGSLPSRHRLRLHHLAWGSWHVKAQGQTLVRGQMNLDATVAATGTVYSDVHTMADVRLRGVLSDFLVKGQVRVQRGRQPVQSLTVESQVQAFASWPVPRLTAGFDGFNLADLAPVLPRTALHGAVSIAPLGKGEADLQGKVDLHNRESGVWDQARLPVRALRGTWQLAGASQVRSIEAVLAAMEVDWEFALPRVRSADAAKLTLKGGLGQGRSLRLSLSDVEPQALHGAAPALRLRGDVSMAPAPRASGANLVARLQGEYGAAFARPERARSMSSGQRSVQARVDARYAPGEVNVSRLVLSSSGAGAELRDVQLRWLADHRSLSKVALLSGWQAKGQMEVRDFDPQMWFPWPVQAVGRNALSAQASFEVDDRWRGQLDAELSPSWLVGVPVRGEVQWRSPRQTQNMGLNVSLDVGGNVAQVRAQLPWQTGVSGRPQFSAAAQWDVQLNARTLQTLQPWLVMAGARQLSGELTLNAQGRGLWPKLSSEGQASVADLRWRPQTGGVVALASAQSGWAVDVSQPASSLRAQMNVRQLQMAGLTLASADGSLNGSLQDHRANVRATVLRGAPKSTVQADGGAAQGQTLAERLTAELVLQGGLRAGAASHDWIGQIQDFVIRSGTDPVREVLRVHPTPIHWQVNGASERVTVGATHLNAMGAVFQVREADWFWADRERDPVGVAKLDMALEAVRVPEMLARLQPTAGWGGDLIMEGALRLTHQRGDPWVVDASLQRRSGDISLAEPTIEGANSQSLGIREARVSLQAQQGIWIMTESFDGRALGKLTGRQVIKAADPMGGIAGTDQLDGELDLSIGSLRPWGTWIPAGWRISGQVQAKAVLSGTLGAPRYSGQVLGDNLGVGQALMGVNLSDGKLRMSLRGDLMVLEHFEARGGPAGGLITAQGQATFGDLPQARMSLTADRFPLLQRVDRRVVLSGVVNGAAGAEHMEAEGDVRVDEGLIDISKSSAPTAGDDVAVINRPAHARSREDATGIGANRASSPEPQRKLLANVHVDLGKNLRVKGMGLDALLTGALRVTTPSNRPALNGVIRAEQGTYAAYGQKLVLERGAIAFIGPIENPRLDILAMRSQSPTAARSDVKVGVAITGTAQDPRVRLYSEPAMSETEKLSWLVLGRAPTGLGGADIGLLQTAAVALLSGEGASPSDNLIGILGLDELSVRQTDGAVRETVVNVGKQVSRYWYVGYERNLNATGGNWQLIYTLARRFTLRLEAGMDNAADLIWSWRWD